MENSGNIKQSLLMRPIGRRLAQPGVAACCQNPRGGVGSEKRTCWSFPSSLPSPPLLQRTSFTKGPWAWETTKSPGQMASVKRPRTSKKSASYWPEPSVSQMHSQKISVWTTWDRQGSGTVPRYESRGLEGSGFSETGGLGWSPKAARTSWGWKPGLCGWQERQGTRIGDGGF